MTAKITMGIRELLLVILVSASACLVAACGKSSGGDVGAANFKAKKIAKDEPTLGARQALGDFSFQPPKGSFERKDQGDNNIWQATGEPRWNAVVKQSTSRAPTMAEMKGMAAKPPEGAKLVGDAAEVDLAGLKALRLEIDQTMGANEIFQMSYWIPVKEDGTTGMFYQVTFTGKQKERAALKPIFEACAKTIVTPHAS